MKPVRPYKYREPLREALLQTLDGLNVPSWEDGLGKTSNANLRWMVAECIAQIDDFPVDKISRWVGFVQGVLAAKGVLDVDKERNRTRPIFHKAYERMGMAKPKSAEMPDET